MSLDWREGHPPKAIYINIPHRMSKACEYTKTPLGQADKGCADGRWLEFVEDVPGHGENAPRWVSKKAPCLEPLEPIMEPLEQEFMGNYEYVWNKKTPLVIGRGLFLAPYGTL